MIERINKFLFFPFIFFFGVITGQAQTQPVEIKYGVINMRALRYYPDVVDATDIMEKAIRNKPLNNYTKEPFAQYNFYEKTSVDVVADKQSVDEQLITSQLKNDFNYKYFVRPFEPWLNHARPIENHPNYVALNTLIFEDYKTVFEDNKKKRTGSILQASRQEGFFETIGQQNVSYLLDEIFGDIDLYQNINEIMLLQFKSPFGDNALKIYTYRLLGMKQVNDVSCYEIAFFCENMKENAFAGYFYITADGSYSLMQARFTLNNPTNMNFLQNILITHTYTSKGDWMVPSKKEYSFLLGDEVKGSLVVDRTIIYDSFNFTKQQENIVWHNIHDKDYNNRSSTYWENIRPFQLTAAQKEITETVKTASGINTFRNIQNAILILLNNHIIIKGINGTFELGPITETISYNSMEGVRLKLGGNSTVKLLDHWLFGGYIAYGTKDKQMKYRGDLIYSLLPRNQYIWEYPKKLFSFTYVNDMNIPGQNLLTTNRDDFIYSFSHASTNNMSLQKIGLLTFENEFSHNVSFKIGGQFKFDQPKGVVQYMQVQNGDTSIIQDISTSEIQLSLRFSPGEKFIQTRDKRVFIRRGNVELNLNHRVGIKGIFGSDYNYQITEFTGYKKFTLGTSGSLNLHLSAGKIWNQVPFPLLFIPEGNQSYIFEPEGYNCMNFYEFTTDNYVAGNLNFMFNWSPFKLFYSKDKIKTTIGARAIYGPLSDNNNPALHPELFVFNQGVNALGNTPYAEVNVGLANIFKILRIEYARRLTYLGSNEEGNGHKILKGSLLFTGSFSF